MKAIILVNVHDDLDLSKAKADVLIKIEGKKIHRSHMRIRPLPERKEYRLPDGKMDLNEASRYGWNKCLDAIRRNRK